MTGPARYAPVLDRLRFFKLTGLPKEKLRIRFAKNDTDFQFAGAGHSW
jgi:hypothetical protein